ncbi:ABC transporter permease subunit [Marinomonas sp.]|uniref:carbohydrate ABC transporter permease n=1 Tax=Marinomonas sp. TaxID=1904862 RepID=UPI003BAB2909
MNRSKTLGPFLLSPALIFVILLFLLPVVMTAFFSFTNMSTATGISGGAYQVTKAALNTLSIDYKMPDLAKRLEATRFKVTEATLSSLKKSEINPRYVAEIENHLLGKVYEQRRQLTKALRDLKGAPRSTRQLTTLAKYFQYSVGHNRYDTQADFLAAVKGAEIELSAEQESALLASTYTGWTWTTENYQRIWNLPDATTSLSVTLMYVFTTLALFNVGFALVLAIATHYMPKKAASMYRGLWLLPRITPPVLYVLLWKWLAWDTGFISTLLGYFDVPSRNWMLDTPTSALVFIILINGFVGASMGMLVLSSAINAIPKTQFWASEVDGANRWQQIRYIILPQLRWPILFITCYQTLSLLASFDYILLATDGGPGGSTEVWSLLAYHVALNNYAGNLQYGYGAALALVLVVLGITLSLIYLKVFGFNKMNSKPRIEI